MKREVIDIAIKTAVSLLVITVALSIAAYLGGCDGAEQDGDRCYKVAGDTNETVPIECPGCGDRCCDVGGCDYSEYTGPIELLRDRVRRLEEQLRLAEDAYRVCEDGSILCGEGLSECREESAALESELGSCTERYTQCNELLGVCAEDLSSCQGELSGCGSGYEECEEQLADCLCNFTQPGEREGWGKYCIGEEV